MREFFNNFELVKAPISKCSVVFQCDEVFFSKYGIYNLASCLKNKIDVHIHFINPSVPFLDKIKQIRTEIDFSFSKEYLNVNINFYKLKSYYFFSRYYIAHFLFNNTTLESAFVTDADIIFNEKIEKPLDKKLGILYYPQHDNLWKKTGANISYIHRDKKIFLETMIEIYEQRLRDTDFDLITDDMNKFERANLYALDQVCMSLAIERFIDDDFVNLTTIDKLISKNNDCKIWSLTGAGQKQNPEVLKKLKTQFKSFLDNQFRPFYH